MARFTPHANLFGVKAKADEGQDDGRDLPKPHRLKIDARRVAGIAEAKAVLDHLPGPGESLHAVCTARMDLTDVINCVLDRAGACDRMAITTLGYNARNLKAMLGWLDSGRVRTLTLLTSIFFRSHKGALWEETLAEFHARNQRAAACHSHCKVVAMAFADGGRLCIEGSANLCGNGSGREQFALINDPGLTDWHAAWINALAAKHGA
ncbi:MAG TPA: hypothetical protein VM597_29250 [Gemmataceae bacterium]|nr:hypothetical protein [Gemmataceae bacterium]